MLDPGTLHLGATPPSEALPLWGDILANRAYVVVAVAACLFAIREYAALWPMLEGCLMRARGNVEIEHSLSMARARNRCFRAMLLPAAVIADRLCVLPSPVPPGWGVPYMLGLFVAWIVLRFLIYLPLGARMRLDHEERTAVHRAIFNYLLVTATVVLPSAIVLLLLNAGSHACAVVLGVEFGVAVLTSLWREGQILRSKFSGLRTILYLCALELLPLAATGAFALTR